MAKYFYPISYRKKVEKWKRGEIDWDGNPIVTEAQITEQRMAKALDEAQTSRLLVQLRLDTLSSMFSLVALLGGAKRAPEFDNARSTPRKDETDGTNTTPGDNGADTSPMLPQSSHQPLEVRGMRLVELTDRTSSVMQSAELDEFPNQDFVFSAFQTFSQLHGMAVAGHVSAVPTNMYAETLVEHAKEARSDMMVIPWSSHGSLADDASLASPGESASRSDRFNSRQYIDFVQGILQRAVCTTGIFISWGPDDLSRPARPTLTRRSHTGLSMHSGREAVPPLIRPTGEPQRVFLVFIGGRDDRAALLFALQLARNRQISVTIAHLTFSSDEAGPAGADSASLSGPPADAGKMFAKEVITEPSASDYELLSTVKQSVSSTVLEERVVFVSAAADDARNLPDLAARLAKETVSKSSGSVGDIILIGRRHACLGELLSIDNGLETDFLRTVGMLGARLANADVDAGLLVIHTPQEAYV